MGKYVMLPGNILIAILLLCGCQLRKNAGFTIGALSFSDKDITNVRVIRVGQTMERRICHT